MARAWQYWFMKIILFFCTLVCTIAAQAQYSTLSIVVKPNKNRTILVDGKNYTSDNTFRKGKKNEFTITDLNPGQHKITVISASGEAKETSFTLSPSYDMKIEIDRKGSFTIREQRNVDFGVSSNVDMKEIDFSVLLQSVVKAEYNSERVLAVTNAFLNPNYHFTAGNCVQLINQVAGDSNKLRLAKLSYSSIIDTATFGEVIDMLNTAAQRSELINFINKVHRIMPVTSMAGNTFSLLVSHITSERMVLDKDDAILAAFSKRGNRFTTSQAAQLIGLSGTENARLSLAKAAFKTLTDPGYFTQLYQLFNAQASRDELAYFVSIANPAALFRSNAAAKVAMTDQDFALVLSKVEITNADERTNTIEDLFSSPYYLLSCQQISRLLGLVKSEKDRLSLLKAAYRITVDRNNFNALANLLLQENSKNELMQYTSTYITR